MIEQGMTILYVSDQEASKIFYQSALQVQPSLDVPGMTEFRLESGFVLGLMPLDGIKRLLGKDIFLDVDEKSPRVELYLHVRNAQQLIGQSKMGRNIYRKFQCETGVIVLVIAWIRIDMSLPLQNRLNN